VGLFPNVPLDGASRGVTSSSSSSSLSSASLSLSFGMVGSERSSTISSEDSGWFVAAPFGGTALAHHGGGPFSILNERPTVGPTPTIDPFFRLRGFVFRA
jgi:hypothetical protein